MTAATFFDMRLERDGIASTCIPVVSDDSGY
jgi:hypothetical protein